MILLNPFLTSISASTKKDFTVNRMYLQTWQQLETWIPYKLRSVCLLLSIPRQNAIKMCIATRWDKSENSNQNSFQYNVTRGIYFSIENLSATKFRMWQSMILWVYCVNELSLWKVRKRLWSLPLYWKLLETLPQLDNVPSHRSTKIRKILFN